MSGGPSIGATPGRGPPRVRRRPAGAGRLAATALAAALALAALGPAATTAPAAPTSAEARPEPPAPAAPQDGDPRIVHVSDGPLPVRAQRGLEGVARALATDQRAYAPLPGIGDPLSVIPDNTTVWVVSDLGLVPGPGPGGRAERWAAGFADSRRGLLAVRASGADAGRDSGLPALRRTFRHELAHLALTAATGGRAPRWLHEGYAQLAAGDWNWQQAWRLRVELLREGGDVLHELSLGFTGREEQARAAYLLSFTAVHELWRRGGDAAMASFFAEMRKGADADAAMRSVYGMTAVQFERAWKDSVKGRYGWLYMLSRASVFWAVLTVAVLVLGIRRWRHRKERWEELRRQDELDELAGRDWEPWEYAGDEEPRR